MLRAIQKKLKNKKGFTLIELIIVIAILGIIAAIAIPRFNGIQETSKEKADDVTAKMIEKAAETYFISEGSKPSNVAALVPKYLDEDPTPQQKDKNKFTLTVDDNGNATVTITKTE